MKVYFIHPSLTLGKHEQAENFYDICCKEMEEHIEVVNVKSETVMLSIDIATEDFIIFFNKDDQNYTSNFLTFLSDACTNKAKFFPIAISKDHRVPPTQSSKAQSFDVVDALRQRRLTDANITTVAFLLSRIVICRIQPTLSKEDMQIFISHRRIDGEDLASLFYNEFKVRAENAFRDLIDIRVGEDAQEIIERNLKQSDVVIFIDTPRSGDSYWIKRELSIALSLNIPIVWVKVGDLDHRAPLDVKPADTPHFYYDEYTLSKVATESTLVDDIIHKAFRISRESAKNVFDRIHTLKSIAKENGITVKKLDSKNMIYRVEIPRKGFRYYQKPLVQIIQCYGRRPKDNERTSIVPVLENLGYVTHPEYGSYFDTTIFLSPIKEGEINNSSSFVTESFDTYVNYLEKYLNPEKHKNSNEKGIIISGAFPDCEPDYQQYLTDAVYSLTKSIFQCNGKVIFGAHPTFQHLIFDMGKMYRTDDYQEAIRLYVSKYFVTDAVVEELSKNANVIATDVVTNSRNESLTLMRKKMISDDKAIALVCMGGKTKSGGHQPGVDEEIALAKSIGLPVFIIGSVGGRSAEIAQYYNDIGWTEKINDLSIKDNIELMTSIDYKSLSNKILNSLGI
jgi:hypothetical protein